ncbi:transcriptional regulator [Patescibacteria group bacterium]|nr:transcriptional regulator [Patescibacteria group bacterium]
MIEQLFGSKTRVKLLKLFYGNPNRAFYVREITRKIDEQINSVRRELSNLLNVGIITSDTTNNKLYYEVNQKYEFYGPLLEIFGSSKTSSNKNEEAPVGGIEEEFKSMGHVDLVVFTGQLTRDSSAPVDVLIVGNVNKNAVDKYITNLEAEEGKEISYTVLRPDDFAYRNQIRDRFVTRIMNAKKQVVLDRGEQLKN